MEKKSIKAVLNTANHGNAWVTGTVGDYDFEAKVFNEPSKRGINKGKVVQLSIYNNDLQSPTFRTCIIDYDKKWIKKPTKTDKPYYDAVMELLAEVRNTNKVEIDLTIWATPSTIADELGFKGKDRTQRITNWIKRKKVVSWSIDKLNLVLVDRTTIPKDLIKK
jgi:hypothetical protein